MDNVLPTGTNASDVFLRMNLTAETKMGTVTNEQIVRLHTLFKLRFYKT